ncbi:serine hydrolase domain-containing protein [Streptomyces sp. NBC_01006]|uniref:serine hydrolase domain-containing protein n=1 Tax=Streptomyces sp. NBC_01006 TaxID=2903716 RepID=UPI00386587DB|nr:beta-lactamase family protein [Streptomyces sp. NBC_01006]
MTKKALPSGHRLRAVSVLALTAALTCTVAAHGASGAQAPTAPAGSTERAQRGHELAGLAQRAVDAGAPGIVVRVDDGTGPAVEVARQAAWSRADRVLAPGDRFRMGSNTKTMVATVILQLVAEHRMQLTDPVEKWLPGAVPNGRAITLRMLLNHTSGLFNHINDPDVLKAFTGQDTRQWTPAELLAAAVRHDPIFPPGTAYSYSNTNYVALGLVAEKASGRALSDLIRERIAEPLHLRNTALPSGASLAGSRRLAHGYEPDAARIGPLLPPGTPPGTAFAGPARPAGHVDTTRINASTEWAAGGVVSTASEWARFDSALLSGKLLASEQLKEMLTTVAEEPGNPNRYGLGLEQVVTPCGTVWGHVGQVPGYSSWDYTDATGSRTVSVFASSVFDLAEPKAGTAVQTLVNAAVCAMLGKPLPEGSHAAG